MNSASPTVSEKTAAAAPAAIATPAGAAEAAKPVVRPKKSFFKLVGEVLEHGGPGYLQFAITNICNADCDFCGFARSKFDPKARRSVTLKEAQDVIDIAVKNHIGYLLFVGGEPMVHKELRAMTRYAAEPDKYYYTVEIEAIGKMETGINGPIAWENSAILGPRLKTGVERAEAIREGSLSATLNWRKLYPKVENQGIETIDGEECFKVAMTPAEGQPVIGYFQKKSGLQVKLTTIASSQLGDIPVEMIASDYKNFGGILEPAKVIQKAGPQEFSMTIDRVEVNPAIPPETFALPAEIRKLVDKTAAK